MNFTISHGAQGVNQTIMKFGLPGKEGWLANDQLQSVGDLPAVVPAFTE
jgi:hypothetical protein